nr:hypothetical protein [Angustibacter aerolatus]
MSGTPACGLPSTAPAHEEGTARGQGDRRSEHVARRVRAGRRRGFDALYPDIDEPARQRVHAAAAGADRCGAHGSALVRPRRRPRRLRGLLRVPGAALRRHAHRPGGAPEAQRAALDHLRHRRRRVGRAPGRRGRRRPRRHGRRRRHPDPAACSPPTWSTSLAIDVVPVLLGGGVRLFADGVPKRALETVGVERVGGRTCLRHRVVRG